MSYWCCVLTLSACMLCCTSSEIPISTIINADSVSDATVSKPIPILSIHKNFYVDKDKTRIWYLTDDFEWIMQSYHCNEIIVRPLYTQRFPNRQQKSARQENCDNTLVSQSQDIDQLLDEME